MSHNEWLQFLSPVFISIRVTLLSSLIAFTIGGLLAWRMVRTSFRGKIVVEAFFMLPIALPPSVIGFILLILLGRRSWIGNALHWLTGHPIIFTWWAAVIASTVVAFPLVYQAIKIGFASVDGELENACRISGGNEWQVARYITIPLAGRSLIAGYLLGFARSLGEFGATLMIAGNIPGKTQTMSTAIYLAVDSGHMTLAWMWVLIMIFFSFLMLWTINKKTNF